jgi:hypothetical protein
VSKRFRIPKKIAGVKIPKSVRKGPVGDFLDSPGGQVLVAEAVVATLGVLGLRRVAAADGDLGDLGDLRDGLAAGSQRVALALRAALVAFRDTLNEDASADGRSGERDADAADESAGDATSVGADSVAGSAADSPSAADPPSADVVPVEASGEPAGRPAKGARRGASRH